MSGKATLLQRANIYNVANSSFIAANEDIFNGSPTTDIVSMENYEEVIFIITKNAGADGTATITVESCDTTVPGVATAVAFKYQITTSGNTIGAVTAATSSGFTTTAGADQIYAISITAGGLSGTNKYVRMKCTEVDSTACDGAIISIAVGPRYAQDVMPEMIT